MELAGRAQTRPEPVEQGTVHRPDGFFPSVSVQNRTSRSAPIGLTSRTQRAEPNGPDPQDATRRLAGVAGRSAAVPVHAKVEAAHERAAGVRIAPYLGRPAGGSAPVRVPLSAQHAFRESGRAASHSA